MAPSDFLNWETHSKEMTRIFFGEPQTYANVKFHWDLGMLTKEHMASIRFKTCTAVIKIKARSWVSCYNLYT